MINDYKLNDIVQMKKDHPCRKSHYWKIVRLGADIKIKCLGCGNVILMERPDFERKCKKIIDISTINENDYNKNFLG